MKVKKKALTYLRAINGYLLKQRGGKKAQYIFSTQANKK